MWPLLLVPSALAAAPPAGAWFAYSYREDVRGTGGDYVGYSDATRATGRYEVTSVAADEVVFHARYDWTYANAEGKKERGNEDRTTSFGLPDRRYRQRIDLDDERLLAMASSE